MYFDHERFSDPNGRYEYTISPEALLVEQIGNAGISNDAEVIIYACGILPYAICDWRVLHYVGHNNVGVYDGSLYEWLGEGLPAEGTGIWEVWKQ